MKYLVLSIAFFVISCSSRDRSEINGKWYTYTESGDYMELWIGEDRALSYLSSIDEFFLYELSHNDDEIEFSLTDSRVMKEHIFTLKVLKLERDLFQTMFISQTKVDSLKTYFLISEDIPNLGLTLLENKENIKELFARREGSHVGHGH